MNFTAAIDLSSFIWCEDDFKENKPLYHNLLVLNTSIFEQIKLNRIPILFRNELCTKIQENFPLQKTNEIDYNYGWATLSFLTNNKWTTYLEEDFLNIISTPEIEKEYFNDDIKEECCMQKKHLLINKNSNYKFLTYYHFYDSEKNIVIRNEHDCAEIETLYYKIDKEILDFFQNHTIKFKHHDKHRKEYYYDYERKENVSPFTCYHNQGQEAAQELLDNGFPFNNFFFNFDLENNVFVRFIKTTNLTYHGHDLLDEGNNIPNEVKKKFSK